MRHNIKQHANICTASLYHLFQRAAAHAAAQIDIAVLQATSYIHMNRNRQYQQRSLVKLTGAKPYSCPGTFHSTGAKIPWPLWTRRLWACVHVCSVSDLPPVLPWARELVMPVLFLNVARFELTLAPPSDRI